MRIPSHQELVEEAIQRALNFCVLNRNCEAAATRSHEKGAWGCMGNHDEAEVGSILTCLGHLEQLEQLIFPKVFNLSLSPWFQVMMTTKQKRRKSNMSSKLNSYK